MSNKNNDYNRSSDEKVELAKQIASSRKRVVRTYANIEMSVLRVVRLISTAIDRLLFNQRYGKLVSLLLAVFLYMTISFAGESLFDVGVSGSGDSINNIALTVLANDEVYEVSGLPTSVNALLVGEMADIQMTKTQGGYRVIADLTGLTEGTHQVNLVPVDFSPRVSVAINPSTAIVTIQRKVSAKFLLDYDFVNINKMDLEYVLSEPVLELGEIIVRAAQPTIESIAFVKAFIDVTGVNESFTKEVPIVAYDQTGNRVAVDIVPSVVKVSVNVSSPNKTVPVIVEPIGEIPNGLAINDIIMDHQSVTLYAPESVLARIEELRIPINATTLTSDTSLVYTISLPTGVRKSSVTKVNMEVSLTQGTVRTFNNVPINFRYNNQGYRFNVVNSADVSTNVEVFGAAKYLDGLTIDELDVYIDMFNIPLGVQMAPLYIEGPTTLIRYTTAKTEIEIDVIR